MTTEYVSNFRAHTDDDGFITLRTMLAHWPVVYLVAGYGLGVLIMEVVL